MHVHAHSLTHWRTRHIRSVLCSMDTDFYVSRVCQCRIRRCRKWVSLLIAAMLLVYMLLQNQVDFINIISTFSLRSKHIVTAAELHELRQASAYFEQQTSCAHRTMTIVSGFVNIGSFRKGILKVHTAGHYKRWAGVIGSIENPIVFFTDDLIMARMFISLRNKSGIDRCTRLHFVVDRKTFWGFEVRETIAAVLSQPGYPRHYPNTVLPDYGAVMHSKYSMLQMAIDADTFATDYFAWMDVGLFRDEAEWKDRPIRLIPPAELDAQKVAFNQAFRPHSDFTPEKVFRENLVHVGGGFFLAKKMVMRTWCEQYRNFTMYFMRRGLTNTDQQVIYAMFLREFTDQAQAQAQAEVRLSVMIQLFIYESGDPFGDWYQLKKLSKDTGDRQMALEMLAKEIGLSSAPLLSTSVSAPSETQSQSFSSPLCNSELTVVTGFFNYGSFAISTEAGWVVQVLNEQVYTDLATKLGLMKNTLIFYSDSKTLLDMVRSVRESSNLEKCTRTVMVTRSDFWSWRLLPTLYARLSATHSHTVPEFYAALHSKFALLENATLENPFASEYLAWSDLSTLQALQVKTRSFIFRQRLRTIESSALHSVPVEIEVSALSRATTQEVPLCKRAIAVSTKYFAASRSAMQQLARTYKFVVQLMLTWDVTPLDNQALHVTFCGSDFNRSQYMFTANNSNVQPFYSDGSSWPFALAQASILYV